MEKLESLIQTAHQLRAPGGCAWDAEQTHQSLIQYLLEETFELMEAIEAGSREEIMEELGDVLYQVIFHSDLASTGSLGEPFDIEDVAYRMERKMRSRHPHVFGTKEDRSRFAAGTGEEVMRNWEQHKQREKPFRTSIVDGIPSDLPALTRANKIIGKAEKSQLVQPLSAPVIPMSDEKELGQLLLAVVASARSLKLDSERALRQAVRQLEEEIREREIDSTAIVKSLPPAWHRVMPPAQD
jgi:XTP/dITP diphosphohydrolase